MLQAIKNISMSLYLLSLSTTIFAAPWFTGPLLAPSGHVMPRGHTNLEVYGIDVFTKGAYNAEGNIIRTPLFRSMVVNPIVIHGFADWLDIQATLPYAFNSTRGVHSSRLTDISFATGIQLFEQKGQLNRLDARILLQETLPTGRYENLNPALYGADATGLGIYQTQSSLNLQYLLPVFETHYLRTRFVFAHVFGSSVRVDGLNAYGGTATTHGRVTVGSENNYDLAFEYTMTQNWVAVLEGYITKGENTRFNGILDISNIGSPPPTAVENSNYIAKALAPALEYNFNSNVGIIGGLWFPVSGKNTPYYTTYMLAVNAYW